MSRGELEEKGSLFMACLALGLYFLFRVQDWPHGLTAVLLPVSAFYSVRTVVRLASLYMPAVGWWLRGLLRWTFYGMVYFMQVFIAGFITAAAFPSVPPLLLCALILGIPALLVIRQALQDYRAACRRFGSLAQAERALHPSAQKFLSKRCRS